MGKGAGRRLLAAAAGGALVVALLLVAEPVRVTSDSMAPTLRSGDQVLIVKTGAAETGDLVAVPDPRTGELLVKRVVGTGGDRVAIEDGFLVVDGSRVPEPQVDHRRQSGAYFGPVTVPPGQLFLLGDNRSNAIDSRTFGPVPAKAVIGRVVQFGAG